MDTSAIYNKCKDNLNNVHSLINYYKKYSNCISNDLFESAVNDIDEKLDYEYTKIVNLLNYDHTQSNGLLAAGPVKINRAITTHRVLFMPQIIDFIEQNRDKIIEKFNTLPEKLKCNYTNNFGECLTATEHLVKRMESVIKKSQHIYQYIKASA